MDIYQILLLLWSAFCIYLWYKWGVSVSQPKKNTSFMKFKIALDLKTNIFSGKLEFNNGDISTLEAVVIGETIQIKTDNDLVYNYYTGRELEEMLMAFFNFNKNNPNQNVMIDEEGNITKI
jgi:hypothetical protein